MKGKRDGKGVEISCNGERQDVTF